MDLWGFFGLCLTSYFPNQDQAHSEQCNCISVPVIPFLSAEEEGGLWELRLFQVCGSLWDGAEAAGPC